MSNIYLLGIVFLIVNFKFGHIRATNRKIGWQNRLMGRAETFEEIVGGNGYLAERHYVITEDGYILSAHRIYGGPKSPPAPKKPLVLLLHGMAASSDVWILRSPKTDLAYLLVDEGFDVWLFNCRGNTYSRRHVSISPENPKFWRFSWHEIGLNDLPATIDYIISHTGISKMSLIGHSMGTTISFVLLSLRPEYNEKVDLCLGLAPVAIFTQADRGALTRLLSSWGKIRRSFDRTGIREIFAHHQFLLRIAPKFCSKPFFPEICSLVVLGSTGLGNFDQFDSARLPFILQHYPAGTTVDTVDHYYQNIANASFRQFDYGVIENYGRYGSAIPPEYPMEKITTPVVAYYGVSDQFVKPVDIQAMAKRIPNLLAAKVVQHPRFGHLDFIVSKYTKELLYDDVINVVKQQKAEET